MGGAFPEDPVGQLFRVPPDENNTWLPAIQVFGEGIFFALSEDQIKSWQKANEGWLSARLSEHFRNLLAEQSGVLLPPDGTMPDVAWAARYLLVHTLAHAVLSEMVFLSGYSTAALRERLFVSADAKAPMAGALIYTAAGDSEGTLGGLVRLGRREAFDDLVRRAIVRAQWCSFDPVCSEKIGGADGNFAACHACCMLPETACETMNRGLDRAMLVGVPGDRRRGFFHHLTV